MGGQIVSFSCIIVIALIVLTGMPFNLLYTDSHCVYVRSCIILKVSKSTNKGLYMQEAQLGLRKYIA